MGRQQAGGGRRGAEPSERPRRSGRGTRVVPRAEQRRPADPRRPPEQRPRVHAVAALPLSGADPAYQNRVGPDDADVNLDPGLRAFVDTLDGRAGTGTLLPGVVRGRRPEPRADGPGQRAGLPARRRRAAHADAAGGRRGGGTAITLSWASNREPDLLEYRVLRAATPAEADDLRRATLVGAVPRTPTRRPARPS